MLNLQETKLGTNKGIPSLVIAASSLDDVLAISVFSVLLSIIFATGIFNCTVHTMISGLFTFFLLQELRCGIRFYKGRWSFVVACCMESL